MLNEYAHGGNGGCTVHFALALSLAGLGMLLIKKRGIGSARRR